jgi:ribosomal protein S18 acetylase RimI-like enzyme
VPGSERAPFTIRTADLDDPDDRRSIVEVLDSYASDPIGGGEPLSDEVRVRLPDALRNHPTSRVFLALADEVPVGLAVCFVGLSSFKARPLLNIHDLAVVPAWRGRGVGMALLKAVEAHARATGCCKLTLEVQDDNARARALYERAGFGDAIVGQSRPTRFLAKALDDEAR